jgi:hypothetical protein
MKRPSPTGAALLLAGPACAIVAAAVVPTMSDDAGDQVTALMDHRSAMVAGLCLEVIAISLMIGGIAWLASVLHDRGGRLAAAGGVLGIAGSLVVLFEDGVSASGPALTRLFGPSQASAALHGIHSGVLGAIDPLALFGDLGLALLAFTAVRVGAPRWMAAAVTIGAFAEGAGFGSGSRALVLAGFAVLLVGLGELVRDLVGLADRPMAATVAPA